MARPYEKILAIDCLSGLSEQLESDIELLDERYQRFVPNSRRNYHEFVAAIRKTMTTGRLSS